jgi:peptide/nickel transport system substrate-binding protein
MPEKGEKRRRGNRNLEHGGSFSRRAASYWLPPLRRISGNEQPEIFSYVFSSSRFPPRGANHGHYSNPQLDALLDNAAETSDMNRRRADYVEAQQILARDLPAINLWYQNTVVVHNRRLAHIAPTPSGSFVFLGTAKLNTAAARK